ncbi:antigen WC1.1 [Penaeus vannamei]|uniref:antigen WC1.1 n=1 Tax=Penaeus vannamei TaxID=6689 RepID=UPI00387F9DE6
MKPTQTATSTRAFLGILLLVLLWARLGLAIYHPDATRPPKVKERVDLKPLPGTAEDADSRPPVRVFRGRHRGPSGESPASSRPNFAREEEEEEEEGVREGEEVARSSSHLSSGLTPPRRAGPPPPPPPRARPPPGPPSCPSPNGLFPHPQDCSKYLNCAGGRVFEQACGPGTVFNPAISACDWPSAVDCSRLQEAHGVARHATTPQPSSVTIFLGKVTETARSAVGSVVGIVNKVVGNEHVDSLLEKVDWTYQRTKDKGKRLLNKLGISDSKTLCLGPDGVYPYPKDCSKFVNCWRGRPSLQRCAPGTLFNSAKRVCDHPHQTVCPRSRVAPSAESVSYVVAPPSGQKVRLRGSDAPWAGYVQIEAEGQWWLVTDSRWTLSDASVVCRSLGFTRGAAAATKGRTFGVLPGNDVRLKRVECQGDEESLGECSLERGVPEDVNKKVVGVRCYRNWVSECGPRGVRWGTKCYYVHKSSLFTHAEARMRCSTRGARLLSITSKEENDFVSELLSAVAGDSEGFHTGGVRQQIFDEAFWLWQNTTVQPQLELSFTAWWPGWNVSASSQARALNAQLAKISDNPTHCITINDNFPVDSQVDARSSAPAEYYFWELSNCGLKLPYVCETDELDIGCIEGRGETYEGTANITSKGLVCLPWSHPEVWPKVAHFGITRDLRHNYCRNLDGDDEPYCFTAKGTTDFCDIPRCDWRERNETAEETTCGADKFTCSSGTCIHREWHCDGQQDCEDGSDERGCRDYSKEFIKVLRKRLQGREVEKWLHTVKVACASRCARAKNFVCMSFNYEQSTQTCILNDGNIGRSGGLVDDPTWEYYERKSLAVDCTDKFVCNDGKCINSTQRCDGRKDCKLSEDEVDCEGRLNFEVRLVNGSGAYEGRVEVKVFGRWGPVCDDMWGLPEGDVVCHQLGFPTGAKDIFVDSQFGSGNSQYLMDDLNCHGNEESLADCDFAGWGEHDCQTSEAAGVQCFKPGDDCGRHQWKCGNGRCVGLQYLCDTIDDCKDNSDEVRDMCQATVEVRLVGGAEDAGGRVSAGRVEVRYLGIWGTVCDDDFSLEEGHVICRMLGWEGAAFVYKNNSFGPGEGQVWLDDVRCLGYESSVADCQHLPWGQNNCDHTEDVGLLCSDTPATVSVGSALSDPSDNTVPDLPSLPLTCGRREVEDTPTAPMERPKVVSGHTPPPGAHPWMVAIKVRTNTGPSQWCGGAILGEDHILTAAHCVYKFPAEAYILKVGDYNSHEEEEDEQQFHVSSMTLHPQFDKGPYLNNDIAILTVKRKSGKGIRFGKYVQPLCLVPPGWNYPSYLNCTVAGWGSLGPELGHSKVLQSAALPILPDSTCRADYVYGPTRLTEGMYCAGYMEGGIDTCQGDSGGPMVCVVDGRHTVVGITSWGHGCARANKPGVYTKLTKYLSWVYSNMR